MHLKINPFGVLLLYSLAINIPPYIFKLRGVPHPLNKHCSKMFELSKADTTLPMSNFTVCKLLHVPMVNNPNSFFPYRISLNK